MKNWVKKYFSGTVKLSRFIVRKEYISSAIWIAALSVFSIVVAAVFPALLPDVESITAMAELMTNPAMAALFGPLFGELSIETLYAASMLLYVGMAVALMNIFFVIRNTRDEEEKGREEVIRSLPVGRLSNMAATLIIALAVNLIIAVIVSVGLMLCGFAVTGAIIYSLILACVGLFFAGVAAVLCQLFASSRTATGFSIILLLLFYVLRGVGDVSSDFSALTYISPLGLILKTKVFVSNVFWPLLVMLAMIAVLCVSALWLNTVRDMGRGLIAEKTGRRSASFLLKAPEGLLFKLMRNSILIWFVGVMLLGAAYGAVMGEMESFISSMGFMEELLRSMVPEGHSLTEAFITMVVDVLVLLAAIPALISILRVAGEEKAHRAENILSKAVSRERFLSAHLIYAFAQSILMLFGAAFGMWATAAIVMEDPITFSNMMVKFFAYLPATLTMLGLAALLVGVLPKKAALITYSYMAVSLYLNYLGPILSMPDWTKYFTPYGVIPDLMASAVSPWPFVVLSVLAVGMVVGSFFKYRRRDLI